MAEVTRRDCLQSTLSMIAGTGTAVSGAAGVQKPVSSRPGMKLATVPIEGDYTYELARQMGVTHAVPGAGLANIPRSRYVDTLARIKLAHQAVGMIVAAVEGGLPSLR